MVSMETGVTGPREELGDMSGALPGSTAWGPWPEELCAVAQ